MSMTIKCVVASFVVAATFGVANAQVMTTPQGDYLSQERYPGYGQGYGAPYGPGYGQPNYYAPPPYYGPGLTPEGDYQSYGYAQPNYYAPRYYGRRTGPEGDYRY